ncbi:laccase domain protein [Alkalithermobacter paradoxus]|uniref:Purine nucleoside phosphorylase n=2 Tax=Alkalithermobacter paradoxus TaxID=29349 RepID=A0A1V4IAA9_9FIRM|nr:laccase domain protein [[Clostridium] thermoalcaliphilum]
MDYIQFDCLEKYPFIKAAFTNKNIDAKNKEDIRNICDELGFCYNNLTFNKQVHGDKINIVNNDNIGKVYEGDGIVTNLQNVPLLIFVADCVPIALVDTKNEVIGLAHAGWRGTFEEIPKKLIDKMKSEYNSNVEDIIAVIGPSIGPCCYEVSYDLFNKFNNKFTNDNKSLYIIKEGRYFLDLWSINEHVLYASGIKIDNIIHSNMCTCCNDELFHSYRKDDKTSKRMGFLLQIV